MLGWLALTAIGAIGSIYNAYYEGKEKGVNEGIDAGIAGATEKFNKELGMMQTMNSELEQKTQEQIEISLKRLEELKEVNERLLAKNHEMEQENKAMQEQLNSGKKAEQEVQAVQAVQVVQEVQAEQAVQEVQAEQAVQEVQAEQVVQEVQANQEEKQIIKPAITVNKMTDEEAKAALEKGIDESLAELCKQAEMEAEKEESLKYGLSKKKKKGRK